jgi:hypothetical protein
MTTKVEIERISPTQIAVQCRKCRERIVLDFGTMTQAEAEAAMYKMNHVPMSCPGYHVELSGWFRLWRMREALMMQYPSDGGAPTDVVPMSQEQYDLVTA